VGVGWLPFPTNYFNSLKRGIRPSAKIISLLPPPPPLASSGKESSVSLVFSVRNPDSLSQIPGITQNRIAGQLGSKLMALFWPICPKALQHFLIALDAYNNFRGNSARNGNVNGIFYAIYFDQFARRNGSFLLGRLNILRVFCGCNRACYGMEISEWTPQAFLYCSNIFGQVKI